MKKANEWIVFTQKKSNLSCTYANNIKYLLFLSQIVIVLLEMWKRSDQVLLRKSFSLLFYPLFFVCFTSLDSSLFVIVPAFPLCPWGGHCLHTLANWWKTSRIWTAEQCAKYWHTNTCTPFMERSHTRIFWFYLAALLPSHAPLCQPAAHTALQLWFYIPVRQNYSLVHNVSQIRRS